jgi:hypothetical protein
MEGALGAGRRAGYLGGCGGAAVHATHALPVLPRCAWGMCVVVQALALAGSWEAAQQLRVPELQRRAASVRWQVAGGAAERVHAGERRRHEQQLPCSFLDLQGAASTQLPEVSEVQHLILLAQRAMCAAGPALPCLPRASPCPCPHSRIRLVSGTACCHAAHRPACSWTSHSRCRPAQPSPCVRPAFCCRSRGGCPWWCSGATSCAAGQGRGCPWWCSGATSCCGNRVAKSCDLESRMRPRATLCVSEREGGWRHECLCQGGTVHDGIAGSSVV